MVGPPSDESIGSAFGGASDLSAVGTAFPLRHQTRTLGVGVPGHDGPRRFITRLRVNVMSKKMLSVLAAYGVVCLGLGVVLGTIRPDHGRTASLVAVGGGGLALVWAGAALAGLKGRRWALVTTLVTAIVLLTQAVHLWTAPAEAGVSGAERLLVSILFLSSLAMMLHLIHGERPPEYYQRGVLLSGDATPNPPSGTESTRAATPLKSLR